ncbi:signal recognition particle 9 kDa protein-domain-containing protein [Hypoxylon rubiginosum]|uniref:Signal recognition particle 9 kDa protein-domain-containing protein n=1 Tax=Hypoxylon rubiginosum TaxID=110542 RepID=A0ACC0DCD8_9PEZI|nr:signal recognition particle 9 kDa protein-domain-containing protein [Hypoxylon rubiginosum]
MPYYATSQEWLHQSSLLLEARPSTTRITTKYHISKPKPRRPSQKPSTSTSSTSDAPRGSLTLKTFDPYSGACLKYRTTKAAEVSRLILSLGKPLGGRMAALPQPETSDEVMADAGAEEATVVKKEEAGGGAASSGKPQAQAPQQQGGGGGKGKKKRGKK